MNTIADTSVQIPQPDGSIVHGDLAVPTGATGVAVFAHGSGSSRTSPRNRRVAADLNRRGLATLLIDLLTTDEERIDLSSGQFRFDVELLADRLVNVADWLADHAATRALRLGYFGASTGAAAALAAAARQPEAVAAVVSRGGRPDLAGELLAAVEAPTLLIVGGNDRHVLELNRHAQRQLRVESELRVVDGATHLFEEPGAMDEVTALAGDWLTRHLAAAASGTVRGRS